MYLHDYKSCLFCKSSHPSEQRCNVYHGVDSLDIIYSVLLHRLQVNSCGIILNIRLMTHVCCVSPINTCCVYCKGCAPLITKSFRNMASSDPLTSHLPLVFPSITRSPFHYSTCQSSILPPTPHHHHHHLFIQPSHLSACVSICLQVIFRKIHRGIL